MAWQVIHYLMGLRRLGFDVWYVEDSLISLRDPATLSSVGSVEATISWVDRVLGSVGFKDRWVVRLPHDPDRTIGALDSPGISRLYREADAVLNLCGSHEIRSEHAGIECIVMVETDPGVPQIAVARGDQAYIEELARYDYLFTYAENIGSAACVLPVDRFEWFPTRPPVSTELWKASAVPLPDAPFTTVASWKTEGKDVEWQGERWSWSKHHEFMRFLSLPRRVERRMEIAIGLCPHHDRASLLENGWSIIEASSLRDPFDYREYITSSFGEFTVAKEQYVKPRSGWFSDRSVCYLAAGRPVIVQDTGLSPILPVGDGLLVFSTEDEALGALESVLSSYEDHAVAAVELAEEWFGSERGLADILKRIGLM
jgi:hypothetical protein